MFIDTMLATELKRRWKEAYEIFRKLFFIKLYECEDFEITIKV